ncbi:MAG: TfuA-like protein [Pseudomonadota bacterium]
MIIFAGPSVTASDVLQVLDSADVRPPARTGDIYKACQEMPAVIGLIDGFFEGVPSVWHKEILWAMDQGIPVFGASSMGALRAAELHAFGMIGVGWIFEAFKDGRLEDDDEVALRHGPQAMNYIALSEPMVNIRVTLDRAVTAGVLDQKIASDLTAMAKAMYFPDRSWEALHAQARKADLDTRTLDTFQAWLPNGRVDQKRQDAMDMLAEMASGDICRDRSKIDDFAFQHTVMWEELTRTCDSAGPGLTLSLLLDAVRQDHDQYHTMRHRASEHMLAQAEGHVPPNRVDRALTQFRTEHRLYTGEALQAWLSERDVDMEELRQRLAQDIILNSTIAEDPTAFRDALLRTLKENGAFDALMAKAKAQAEIVRGAGYDMPTPDALGFSPVMLLMWYFEEFRRRPVPQDMDVFLHDHGFASRDDFEQMMARQYVLWQHHG